MCDQCSAKLKERMFSCTGAHSIAYEFLNLGLMKAKRKLPDHLCIRCNKLKALIDSIVADNVDVFTKLDDWLERYPHDVLLPHIVTYMGEDGGFNQGRLVMTLVCLSRAARYMRIKKVSFDQMSAILEIALQKLFEKSTCDDWNALQSCLESSTQHRYIQWALASALMLACSLWYLKPWEGRQ
jgi:hypothetical protein